MAESSTNGNGTSAPMDPLELARRAGLSYVDDSEPGIRRRVCGRGFTYLDAEGETIRDQSVRDRLESLAIPPAWEDVWICAAPDGHLQATGRDAEGRKQYRYHERWRDASDRVKFRRLGEFGETLPRLRQTVGRDLAGEGLGRSRVAAAAVRLLDRSAMRVGNEVYAEKHGSFGVASLLRGHVRIKGNRMVQISFTAKGGQDRSVEIEDPELVQVVRDLRSLPGDPLFKCRTEAGVSPLGAEGVNEYLHEVSGRDVSAKTFRTWAATLEAFRTLLDVIRKPAENGSAEAVGDPTLTAVDRAAEILGNTRATARSFYVHPGLLGAQEAGDLRDLVQRLVDEEAASHRPGFRSDEPLLLALLPHLDPYMLDESVEGG